MSGEHRLKYSAPETVLPPVAQLIGERKTFLRYFDLDGVEHRFDYKHLVEQDPFPIPMPVDREGYGTVENSAHFWATGHGDWLNVQSAVNRYMDHVPVRIFDFGCATCRFLRHALLFGKLEIHGCDYAPANVHWIETHLSDEFRVILNSSEPKLNYENDFFDITTAFSVFTHIDQDWDLWLAELARVTAPEGLLYLTIMNDDSWSTVNERPHFFEHLQRANTIEGNLHVDEQLFKNPMSKEKIVFRTSKEDIYNCNVWLKNEFVIKNWTENLEILTIAPLAHSRIQAAVIARPKK